MAWKYVIMRVGNREVPVLFPESMVHAHMAEMMQLYFATEAQFLAGGVLSTDAVRKIADSVTAASAGSCEVRVLVARDSGSETLGIKSRFHDTAVINMHPYTGGYVEDEEDPNG
jgi:hypothetical protein